jgi:hypothetical protein
LEKQSLDKIVGRVRHFSHNRDLASGILVSLFFVTVKMPIKQFNRSASTKTSAGYFEDIFSEILYVLLVIQHYD